MNWCDFDDDSWKDKPVGLKIAAGIGLFFVAVIAISAIASAFVFGLGALVYVLWNWLMPEIFGLPVITFWQAVGLLILSHLLLKSPFGNGGGGGGGSKGSKKKRKADAEVMLKELAERLRSADKEPAPQPVHAAGPGAQAHPQHQQAQPMHGYPAHGYSQPPASSPSSYNPMPRYRPNPDPTPGHNPGHDARPPSASGPAGTHPQPPSGHPDAGH